MVRPPAPRPLPTRRPRTPGTDPSIGTEAECAVALQAEGDAPGAMNGALPDGDLQHRCGECPRLDAGSAADMDGVQVFAEGRKQRPRLGIGETADLAGFPRLVVSRE